MVKTAISLTMALVLLVAWTASCGRSKFQTDVADFRSVQSSFMGLSLKLMPILSNSPIASIEQLALEYGRRHPNKTPLFTTRDVFPEVWSGDELPTRMYFWLPKWGTNDPPTTPMLWSYFRIPKDVVLYLAINGTENFSPSNEFFALVAPLSNRVEKATLKTYEQIRNESTGPR